MQNVESPIVISMERQPAIGYNARRHSNKEFSSMKKIIVGILAVALCAVVAAPVMAQGSKGSGSSHHRHAAGVAHHHKAHVAGAKHAAHKGGKHGHHHTAASANL